MDAKARKHRSGRAKPSYAQKTVNREAGRALHRYEMVSHGDRILVALSGGKDSLTLLSILSERLQRIPIDYTLHPVYIDPGFEGGFADDLSAHCKRVGHSLRVEKTDNGLVAHSAENRENPCFLCAWRRRKRLFEIAEEMQCRKIALGHHKDDIIETLFMNMCYAGEISTMMPSQTFFNGLFTVIRPLAFVEEETIRSYAAEAGFPVFENPCPTAGSSKRQEIKTMLGRLYRSNRKIKGNIFRSMSRVKMEYLLQ